MFEPICLDQDLMAGTLRIIPVKLESSWRLRVAPINVIHHYGIQAHYEVRDRTHSFRLITYAPAMT